MTRIKICGITNSEDAVLASDLGADALGFVFANSPRRITPQLARRIVLSLPPFLVKVGVFVNEGIDEVRKIYHDCGLNFVQLHGEEDENYINSLSLPTIKAFRVADHRILDEIGRFDSNCFLLDAYDQVRPGGTGRSFDWEIAKRAAKIGKLILSGGLDSLNVRGALEKVRPYGVDVSSGVERKPGVKDPAEMQRFIKEVREWDSQTD
jgi:phosphoribosylanthranilate isomerase